MTHVELLRMLNELNKISTVSRCVEFIRSEKLNDFKNTLAELESDKINEIREWLKPLDFNIKYMSLYGERYEWCICTI